MKRNRKLALGLVSGLVVAVLGGTAPMIDAAQINTNLGVGVNVTANCSVTATPVTFANYHGNALFANGSVTINCSTGLPYSIALGGGTTPGPSGTRQMTPIAGEVVSGFIPYYLYQDVNLAVEWGDGGCLAATTYSSGGCQLSVGIGVGQAFTVYGKTGTGPSQPSATYNDTVLVTVSF
jgi:spore coat protein U-like protein